MAKDYQQMATQILEAVGGPSNVQNAAHCMTRLRLTLKDTNVPVDDEVKKIKGVLGVNRVGAQYQVIIGQDVPDVYRPFCELAGVSAQAAVDENLDEGAEKTPLTPKAVGQAILDYLSGSMVPIIPALMVSGLFKAIEAIFGPSVLGLFSEESNMYFLCEMVFNAAMYFIPIYLGYTASKKIGVTPILGMLMAGILIEPSFVDRVAEGTPFDVFGLPVRLVDYSQSVIPILLSVWVMSYVEKFFSKIMPTALKTVFVPFCTIVVMLPVTLCALAPLGNFIGEGLGKFLLSVFGQGGIVAVLATAILVAVQPFLVITGMHVVIGMMAVPAFIENGYDNFILLANFVSNWAVWGMALAGAIRLKDKDEKADALSSFISGFIGGVVEPALYGIGFKYPKAFSGAVAGGFCAGLFAAIVGVREYVLGGGSSALGVVTFVNGDVPSNFAMGVATCAIALVVGTAVAAVFGFNEVESSK